ncbi:ABC transporter substrate-binding protein [Halomonas sp. GD1P12]|uniref:ABC transporter substrate-binding protein n=1 Tax=Halomonas sp. GD1P12 TaxID=2982691 RepID=UPI0021E3691E|nr:ABC transporter substrate-binding protein [Halomonas sp. GD1P12]UYF99773.1 ABC transporter substrate-binding protein [Halomonas sp. GD1P12]
MTLPVMHSSIHKTKATAITLAALLMSGTIHAADRVTFQLDWLPGGDKAPVYVGLAQGFFEERDLDVHISQGRGSTDAITKLATGQADIGLSDITALMIAHAEGDVPVKGVYSVFSQPPHAFYVLKDSDIEQVSDVADKRIATSPFTSSNLFLPLLLEMNGVEEQSVNLIQSDPGTLSPMLLNGRTDVVISWITDQERYADNARSIGQSLRVIPWHEAGLEAYATTLIASERFLDERPDVAKRFVEAYEQAIEYTWANPEQAAVAVNDVVPEVEIDMAARTIEAIRSLVFNDFSAANGLGTFEPGRLASTWQWTANAQEMDPEVLDPESIVDRRFLPGSSR